MQRCQVQMCRNTEIVQRYRGGSEVQRCRGASVAGKRRMCRGTAGAGMQGCRDAEVQRCRGAGVQMCRGADAQSCNVQMCRCAEV